MDYGFFNIFRSQPGDRQHAELYRRTHTLSRERFAMALASGVYALLAAANVFGKSSSTGVALLVFAILATSVALYRFRPRKFRNVYIDLFSLYYLFLFFLVYYFPLFIDRPQHDRSRGYEYLVHLSILIAQALRPHLRGGAVLIAILAIHSAITIYLDDLGFDTLDVLRLVIFLWLGLVVLYIERLNYLHAFKYFDITRRKEREEEELLLARRVHKNLFPTLKENERVRLHSRRISPYLTGGDFFDVVYLREGNLGIFFTDISGHGISSAMMSAAVKVILSSAPYRL